MKTLELTELKNSTHFCVLPWIHFHAWPDTKVFPCCMSDSSKPVASTTESSIIKMMNSEDFKALRLRMLNDEPSDICKRCYDVEKLGTWSLRKSHNTVKLPNSMDLVQATNPDGSINKFKLKYMDIRFSNICNMKCRSCGPSCSSQWAQEYQERHGAATLQSRFGLSKIVVANNEDGSFWEKLLPYLDDVEEVYFAGGEALITPEHYQILDYWLQNDKNNVKVTYTTNLSVLKYKDKHVFDYWKQFPRVEVYASIDAGGTVAEFARKGTDWQQIEANALLIKKECPHVRFEITPTISIWNAFQFPEFHQDWIKKGILSKHQEIRLNILTFPWYASMMILPPFIKDKLLALYRPVANDETYSDSIRNGYKTVMNTLKSGETNEEGLKEFFHANAKLDDHRRENIFTAIPELQEIYKWLYR